MTIIINGIITTKASASEVETNINNFIESYFCGQKNSLKCFSNRNGEVVISGNIECAIMELSAQYVEKALSGAIHRDFGQQFELIATESKKNVEA
jgi:hypothetical protein